MAMPRKAREKSATGIYAVLITGSDKGRRLFYDDEDYNEFISRIDDYLDISAMAFALVENAICLIVKESEKGIGWDIKPITTGYARYFGARYECSGGLFAGRFKSKPIEDGEDMAAQLACIHRLCETIGAEGYTGRYDGDELFLADEAVELMGGKRLYDEEMHHEAGLTTFFASVGGKKPVSARKRKRTAADESKKTSAELLNKKTTKAAKELAAKDAEKAAKEKAARKAEKAAEEKAAREAEKAAEEKAAREAEKAAKEKAAREAEEKAKEKAARIAAEEKAKEEAARKAAEEKAKEEAARRAEEEKKEEAARIAAEEKEKEEAARKAAEEKEKKEQLAAEETAAKRRKKKNMPSWLL
jgi:hypothetical protein